MRTETDCASEFLSGEEKHMRTCVIVVLLLATAIALGRTDQACSKSRTTSKVKENLKLVPVAEIGSKVLILGQLGVPIGETVTVSGVKKANGPLADYFWVDTVNGKKLSGVRGIQVEGIANWPDGTRATLRGHEVGTIRFLSLRDGNTDPRNKRFKPHQTIFLSFRVKTIVNPKNLKLKAR
jgi:hypothetical protein